MKDVEYVKQLLASNYATELSHEIPYPSLAKVISATGFDYLAGKVEGAIPINSESREGHPYLQFEQFGKRILSHRFIAAVTLGKWVPRECHIDHINHNPSDNRPVNLRITTPRDNMGNRRNALLSELADIEQVGRSCRDVELARRAEIASEAKRKSELKPRRQEITKLPTNEPDRVYRRA